MAKTITLTEKQLNAAILAAVQAATGGNVSAPKAAKGGKPFKAGQWVNPTGPVFDAIMEDFKAVQDAAKAKVRDMHGLDEDRDVAVTFKHGRFGYMIPKD